jgi:para-nitrobenzyl esterase
MDRRSFLGSTTAAAAGLLLGSPRAAAARQDGGTAAPVAETTLGRVRGYLAPPSPGPGGAGGRVYAFRGVPYAASTAGANRFMPPRRREPWTGVRDAIELGLRAPQLNGPRVPEWFVMDRFEPMGEDCLVVNVWTPALNDNGRRPVMVWLHGGGFTGGSNGFSVYDGANLARTHDVVVVGVNHRLNVFGFLYLAQLGGEPWKDTGNVGMLDVVAALEWVRDNAAQFGGDASRVTVFGQSGGGSKTSTLYGMPAAKGLFHRGIVMSGNQVRSNTPEQATRTAEAFIKRLTISRDNLDEIQKIPMRRIREALNGGGAAGGGGWGPVMGVPSLPEHTFDPRASALSAGVPMMIGSTETETTWNENFIYDPLTSDELREDVMRNLRTDAAGADQVIALYRQKRSQATNLDLYLLIESDNSNFRLGTDTQADRKASTPGQAPVYKYYFQWYSPVRGGQLRSMHTMDVPFAFQNHTIAHTELGTGPELQPFADRMSGAWAAFAATGNPNHRGIPAWPAYDTATRATMVMNNEWKVVNNPYGEEKAAIAAVRNRVPPAGAPDRNPAATQE